MWQLKSATDLEMHKLNLFFCKNPHRTIPRGAITNSDFYFLFLNPSFSETDRLNTKFPGLMSVLSTQKYPKRIN